MAIIQKGLRKIGRNGISTLLPSRSADSISRLIDSTQFKMYRASVGDATKSGSKPAFSHGQRVMAFWSLDREWFPATIISRKARSDGKYEICWDDGDCHERLKPASQLKPLDLPSAGTALQVLFTIHFLYRRLSDLLLCLSRALLVGALVGRKSRHSHARGGFGACDTTIARSRRRYNSNRKSYRSSRRRHRHVHCKSQLMMSVRKKFKLDKRGNHFLRHRYTKLRTISARSPRFL